MIFGFEQPHTSNTQIAALTKELRVRVLNCSASGCLVETNGTIAVGTVAILKVAFGGSEFEDTVQVATKGDVLYVPQNVPHGFKVSEHMPARLLMMFCPALDREKYFEALEELSANGQPPDQDALLALMNRFDQYPLD